MRDFLHARLPSRAFFDEKNYNEAINYYAWALEIFDKMPDSDNDQSRYCCERLDYCNERLEKTKTETIVNSKSEEAKNYDFSNGDGFLVGNIKFIRTVFRCNKCDKTYTIKEVKENDIAINRWK